MLHTAVDRSPSIFSSNAPLFEPGESPFCVIDDGYSMRYCTSEDHSRDALFMHAKSTGALTQEIYSENGLMHEIWKGKELVALVHINGYILEDRHLLRISLDHAFTIIAPHGEVKAIEDVAFNAISLEVALYLHDHCPRLRRENKQVEVSIMASGERGHRDQWLIIAGGQMEIAEDYALSEGVDFTLHMDSPGGCHEPPA